MWLLLYIYIYPYIYKYIINVFLEQQKIHIQNGDGIFGIMYS